MSEECCHHNCIEELKADHEKILEELGLLEKAVKESAVDKKQVENFLRFTGTFAEPHHHKEEEVLFPELEKKGVPNEGGPIGMMLMEHATKREYVKNLKKALDENNEDEMKKNALAIVSLLGEHIFKENNILYPMAEDVLSEDDMSRLSHKCREIEKI
ncbi:MAG: hypothetical protein A3A94_03300 [Candidatus Portnoybacteria bacterium RIFCSPLOWO2_01_FULL_43_11]|uniref:Hemerythrin-like domain-containing protein n=2 Tax=Candidatus Portnoyibacteriota TaxID=1817913 RepID=A0A1G2FHM1_9BACT|nr:MAG: hypothetical protein A3E90_00310 [Candidatus Portnoybacteria bacterium RIFCSPHIGHO2_12_FULL_40_11]OGZ38918.1 MAG: hypothetical protein A3A94_03300 [Candidatus Portnoybacteria bacterium RIFCSPLOWO2_01_FULL_43_11]